MSLPSFPDWKPERIEEARETDFFFHKQLLWSSSSLAFQFSWSRMKTPGDTGELAMIVVYHCLSCLLTQQGWQCVITNLYNRFNKKGVKTTKKTCWLELLSRVQQRLDKQVKSGAGLALYRSERKWLYYCTGFQATCYRVTVTTLFYLPPAFREVAGKKREKS